MTSQVSLTVNSKARRYRPWAHSFCQAMGENKAVTILNTILFAVVIVLPNLLALFARNGLGVPAHSAVKYSLFEGSMLSLFFPALALETALLQGLLAFRFLFHRRAANAWFGMGLSRHALFCSRFAAGAVGALLPLFVVMVTSLAVNLALFADVGLVLARFAFFALGMGLQVLALYGVVVLVCCASKTLAEGIAYSLVLMMMPSLLLMSLNGLTTHLLPGCGLGVSDTMYYSWNTTLVRALSDWNPLIFMSQYLDRFGGEAKLADPAYLEYLGSLPALSIRWVLIPGWLATVGALLWFAHRVFLKTGVEHTGALGAGKTAAYASVLTIGFFAFALVYMLPVDVTRRLSLGAMLAIAVATAGVVMLLAALPVRLLRRRFWKGVLPIGAGLAAMLALVGVFVSGGLGYSGFVPAADTVKSVRMSYNGLDFYMPKHGGGGQTGLVPDMSYRNDITLEDKADIAAAVEVHRALTQAGLLNRNTQVGGGRTYGAITEITYTMANGGTVTRAYQALTPDLMKRMMAMDNTAAVKTAYRDYLLTGDGQRPGIDNTLYHTGNVYLCAPFFGSTQPLGLDEAQREKLLNCIANDLADQTPEDRYLPAKPETCILAFTAGDGTLDGIGSEGGFVYVTEQFTETLAYLRENGWLGGMQNTPEIESVGLLDYGKMDHSYDYNALYSFPIFFSGFGDQMDLDWYQKRDGLKLFLTDKAQQQEVLSRSHGLYLASEGGYVVFIKYKGRDQLVSAFLPAKDAPSYVVEGAK